jgi:hypothetical protein
MLRKSVAPTFRQQMMAIAIKIIIEKKRIDVTFESSEAKPQKTAIQL